MQATRQSAGQLNGSFNEFDDMVHGFGFRKRFGRQLLAQNLSRQGHASQVLAQTVVQIVTDALLFALTDAQDFLLQTHALLHLVVQRRRSWCKERNLARVQTTTL